MVHIWTIDDWKDYLDCSEVRRTGLRLRMDANVNSEVKLACKSFAFWLRSEYCFPLRIPIYVKSSEYIKTLDGDQVKGSFFEPFNYSDEPYIRIATGDYEQLKKTIGKDNALASILLTIAHELTHYYQWINNLNLTPIGRERQATQYSHYVVDEYSLTRDHP